MKELLPVILVVLVGVVASAQKAQQFVAAARSASDVVPVTSFI